MRSLFMLVYNDIATDARVLRAANALCDEFQLSLYAVGALEHAQIQFLPVKNCARIGGAAAQLRFIFGAVRTALRERPQIVYAHDIFSAVPMMLLRWLGLRAKFVYDAHELFLAEEHPNRTLVDRLQYWFERRAIRSADVVICAQERRAEIMQQRHRLAIRPTVIRNISYLQCPPGVTERQRPAGAPFRIVYAGGLLPGRRLDLLIEAVRRLGNGYELLLVGDGPDYARLETLAQGQENIRLQHSVPYARLGELLSGFDAGYLYYPEDTLNNRYAAPNKIFEYAGVGLPIIANENPTIAEELERAEIGVCSNDICEAIRQTQRRYDALRQNLRRYTAENSLAAEMEKLKQTVKGMSIS